MASRIGISLFCAAASMFVSTYVVAETQRELHAAAKVKEIDARRKALTQVPAHSEVQGIELEREGGRLVWSYDLKPPFAKEVTEVKVDAITGEVVDMHKESAREEAAEKAADKN